MLIVINFYEHKFTHFTKMYFKRVFDKYIIIINDSYHYI